MQHTSPLYIYFTISSTYYVLFFSVIFNVNAVNSIVPTVTCQFEGVKWNVLQQHCIIQIKIEVDKGFF